MFAYRHLALILCIPLLVSACASASKRLEQGMEMESQGNYDAAVYRYVDALKKDSSLQEARTRLMDAGEQAIAQHLKDSGAWANQGDPVSAAHEYEVVDALLASARSVGVRLPAPPDYTAQRRDAFDAAIGYLLAQGRTSEERGRWQEGLHYYQRARQEFEPSIQQRDVALTGESAILLGWSQAELRAGHLRSAYDWAAAVHALEWTPPENDVEATQLMEQALAMGEVELMVLPVVAGADARDPQLLDLEVRVNDLLDQSYWRSPPPFIRLSDPVEVREVVRQAEILDNEIRAPMLGLLLRLVDAEYGAWLQLVDVQATEYEVRQTTKQARTRSGATTQYVLEEGKLRLRAQAHVIVVDRHANEVTNLVVMATGTGPFRRGRYAGKPTDLNLGRGDVDLFDPVAQEAQEQAVRQALALDLSSQLAPSVLEPVLARVP